MTRSTPFRLSLFEISFGILAALALALSPQAALAQHGGGGGHAGGGGHIGGGGGHFGGGHVSGGASFGAAGHSSAGSHVSSPIHVFSGPRSAPVAAAPARALENSAAQPGSSNIHVSPSGMPPGLGMFAQPGGSGDVAAAARANRDSAAPMHTTIGFPPSTDPRFASIASAHRGAPLMITGQGDQVWQTSRADAAANRNSARVTETRQPLRVSPEPPHRFRRPPLGGAPFLNGSAGFLFFSPGFGFFGPGFGCDPFFTPSFGCGGFFPFGFGGFGYGFDGGYGGFNDAGYGYGYDNGYYPPPNYDVTAPNGGDEGASQEPAPGPYLNPPAENPGAESPIPVPDTVIYLKGGTSFAVRDYWVANGELHYVTSYGGENAVDLSELDLQRTTDENAKQGIAITLRPAPDAQPPAAQPAPEGTHP